jgi:TPR repeat protein
MFNDGDGVAKDRERALRLSRTDALLRARRSCEGGKAAACYVLANYYEDGEGVEKDRARAARYFKRACELGDTQGCDVQKRPPRK